MVRKLSYQDMMDLIAGGVILGCGGGGDPANAIAMVDEIFTQGKEFTLLDPRALDGEDWVCILGYVGGGIEPKEKELVKDLKRVWPHPIAIAARELASHLRVEFKAYLPSEIGAGNTVTPMYIAALQGKSDLDGDAAGGRAKPELAISTTHLAGIATTPAAMATYFGESLILQEALSDERVESLCRYVSRAAGGRVAVARCPGKGSEILRAVHPNSISLAIAAGRSIRENQGDPVKALVKTLHGNLRFRGRVDRFSREERDGFMWGDIFLDGSGNHAGESYKIWFKNENLVAWRNGRLDVTCPEGIVIVDAAQGTGIYNWGNHFAPGREVAVIGVPAVACWRTPKGIEIFGPRHFGFDFDPQWMEGAPPEVQ